MCNYLIRFMLTSISLFLLMTSQLDAKYSTGVITTAQNWVYLERFCFISEDGMLSYLFQYPAKYELESIILYFDTNDQWTNAYDKNKNCKQKEEIIDLHNNQIIHLSPVAKHIDEASECTSFKKQDEQWYQCIGNRSFFSRRPRWWYLALSNCDAKNGLYLDYSILMTNAPPTNKWFYHFSFDEFYVLPISILFMLVEIIIVVIAVIFTFLLKSRNMFHATFKLFLNSLALDLAGLVLLWVHYDRYADNGRGFPLLKSCALLLRQFATVVFVLLLLLIAKGYTITRGKMSPLSTVKLLVFITIFLIAHVIMLIWEIALFDPAEVTYISESIAAYIIGGMRIVAWFWYLFSSFISAKKYPGKRTFYIAMAFLMTIWFWAGPVALIVSNFVLDNWVRSEVMLGVESAVMVFGFSTFLVLTAPLPDNRNFPYHTRVNQISQENYPQHVYEVQYMTTAMSNGNGIELHDQTELDEQEETRT